MTGERRRVTFENERQIRRALSTAGDELEQMRDGHAAAGRVVTRALAATAPRRTGRLARSHRADVDRHGVTITSPLVYAPVIDSGWPAHGIEASHYAQAALDRSERDVTTAYQRQAEQIARKAERVTA